MRKKYIKASYETQFWDLHDRDMETGIQLEEIVDDFGLTDAFFPDDGEPTADSSDYQMVLREYESANETAPATVPLEDILEDIRLYMKGMKGIKRVDYMDEIDALRFTLNDGHTYQFVVQDLKGL